MLQNDAVTSRSVRYIDAMIRVTGVKTGYSFDIPVRYIKSVI